MKHFIFSIVTLFCLSTPSFSQDGWTCRKEINFRFGYDKLLSSDENCIWNGQIEYAWHMGKAFGLGIGAGVCWPNDAAFVGIPLTLRASYRWHMGHVSPYISIQCNAPTYINDGFISAPQFSTLCLNPMLGVKIPVAMWMALDFNAGYMRYGFYNGSKGAFGIKTGISLGWGRKHTKVK